MTSGKMRRTWPQRLTIALLVIASVAALGTAGGLAAGQWVLSDRKFVEIAAPSDDSVDLYEPPLVIVPGATTTTTAAPDPGVTTTTVALAEPDAANFLIAGADGGDCLADDPTVGPRDGTNRSDTVMVWRVSPATNQVAVLSFPRDLYVQLPSGRKGRINESYRDGPQAMVDTIWSNFGVPILHYLQVDFCAFLELVDAVGGVTVPFATPARDRHIAFEVPAGCVNLDGDMALRYVRSRYYEWQDEDGDWHQDGTSDFGRISRQQDFIRRVIAKVISDGLYKPDTVAALLKANSDYLRMDTGLTVRRVQEFANVLRRVNPAEIATYRIESRSKSVGGASMQEPLVNGDNMKAILEVFRGHATLASAPDQVFPTAAPPTTPDTTDPTSSGRGPTTTLAATTTLPTVTVEDNNTGVSPDPTATC